MFDFLHKFFNHDKIDELNRCIDIYKERNEQLEKELSEYKGYKLKYEVTKLYVEGDDAALLELFEIAKKAEEYRSTYLGILTSQSGACANRDRSRGYGGGVGDPSAYGYAGFR